MRIKASIAVSGSGKVLFPGGVEMETPRCGFHYVARGKRPPEIFGWVQLKVPFLVVEKYFRDSADGRRRSDSCLVTMVQPHGNVTEMVAVFVTDKRPRKSDEPARLIAENVHVIRGPWW